MWTERDLARLKGVDPRLVAILEEARRETGINFGITEGLRDRERQAEMVRTGKSQTMNSRHLHGNAVDIVILNPDGSANWDFEAYRPISEAAKAAAARLGYNDFVWGGDWKTLRDGVHFQIGGPAPGAGPAPAAGPGVAPPRLGATGPSNALAGILPSTAPQNALAGLQAMAAARPQWQTNALDPRAFQVL